MERRFFRPEHVEFREAVRSFAQSEIVPQNAEWQRAGLVDRELFGKAGDAGFLGLSFPREYGGQGLADFRYSQIISEEFELAGVGPAGSGIGLHNDMVLPYLARYCSDEQKERWFRGVCSGELIGAIAITEPLAGSDIAGIQTTAAKNGEGYVVNGCKTLIGNGINADLVIVLGRAPGSARHDGLSLLVVERGLPGIERRRNLGKAGRKAQDTAELVFENVVVPAGNLLGDEGHGFEQLMENLPVERLTIAISAIAGSRYSYGLTLTYVRDRQAFGKPIGTFQNSRFAMAEIATEIQIAQVFVDECVEAINEGTLTAVDAAMAKWWCTELQKRVNDACLQLHGGHGYLEESPISWAWRDGRVTTIYGGTTEIMKEIVGRSLGL